MFCGLIKIKVQEIFYCIFIEVGLFKEIICDHSLNGQPLPTNLIILGALNPVRRRKQLDTSLKRKDMAGVEA